MESFSRWLNCVSCVPYLPTCQKRGSFSFLRANVPVNMPTCQRRANFSSWRASVSKTCHFFQLRLPNGVPNFKLIFKRIFLIYKIYLYLIYFVYFVYFVYFKYIPNIYLLYEYIFLPKFIRGE